MSIFRKIRRFFGDFSFFSDLSVLCFDFIRKRRFYINGNIGVSTTSY
jgi:hypothetical protein